MTRLHTLYRLACLAIASVLLTGCEQPPQQALVFAISSAPASLHPVLASDAVSERINNLLYSPLLELDAQGRARPGQVAINQLDELTYRLQLQPGLLPYSDGSKPSIEDVLLTLQQARDTPTSPHAATLSHLSSSQLDQGTLLLRLSRPDPRFAEKLHLGLAPASALRDGKSLARHPVGNGAYEFVAWDAQERISLKRLSDGLLLHFEPVPDPTMRALKLIRGEIHLLQNDLPYELYDYLQAKPQIALASSPGTTFSYLGFNLHDPLTGDRRIRQAIAHAIDREAIVRHLFLGHARTANTLLHPQHWAANPDLEPYAYDPARAQALLAQAGYGPQQPLQLSYKTSTDPFRLRIAAALQAQLAEVGIELSIASYEWGTFFADIKAGRFQLYSLSWVGIRSPDIFRYVFHSDSLPPQGANRGRYINSDVDTWIEQADVLPPAEARPLFVQIQQQLHQDLVYVPLWHEDNLLLSRNVEALQPLRNGSYAFLKQVSFAP